MATLYRITGRARGAGPEKRVVVGMIEETCVEIGELEERWLAEKHQRHARRRRIQQIDALINEFEQLNLADEVEVPRELRGRVVQMIGANVQQLTRRESAEISVSDWMDVLYEVQDGLMVPSEDEAD